MPRFVILEHDHPHLHWDLMLECGGVLRTWRLPGPPAECPVSAMALGDHRVAYLDYEGPVSGNRGAVKRWDHGAYEALEQTVASWRVRLHGGRWQGEVSLHQSAGAVWDVACTESGAPGRQG